MLPCLLLQCFTTVSLSAADNPAELVLHRWAILADSDVRESGIQDLLTVELSGLPEMELVERDQLQLVTREVTLERVFNTESSRERLQLGRVLNADALLFLKKVQRENGAFLQWIVAECSLGARLSSHLSPYDGSHPEKVVLELVESVQKTRKQFSGGVRHLVAVSPFLSKNLLYHHDHLQHGLAAILSDSLISFPGVAVVELEEARAIARELEVAGTSLRTSAKCLFVAGEFKTETSARAAKEVRQAASSPGGSDVASTVRVQLEVKDGGGARKKLEPLQGSFSDVTQQLRTEVTEKILDQVRGPNRPALTATQQKSLLTARAHLFAQIGSLYESIRLREATLLLAPENELLRMSLVADCRLLMSERHEQTYRTLREPRIREQLELFRRTAPHVEWLVRRDCLSIQDAGELVGEMCSRLRHYSQPGSPETKQAMDEFFWSVAGRISSLTRLASKEWLHDELIRSRGRAVTLSASQRRVPDRVSQVNSWIAHAARFALEHSPHANAYYDSQRGGRQYPSDDRGTLEALYRVMTELAPADTPSFSLLFVILRSSRGSLPFVVREQRLEPREMAALFERVRETKRPAAVFYADCGKLALEVHLSYRTEGRSGITLLEHVQKSLEQWKPSYRVWQTGVALTEALRKPLLTRAGTHPSLPAPPRGTSKPVFNASTRKLRCPIPPVDPNSRVQFELLDGPVPDWWEIIPVAPKLDVVWSRNEVSVMREPGRLVTLYEIPESKRPRMSSPHAAEVETKGFQHGNAAAKLDAELFPLKEDEEGLHEVRCDGNSVWMVTTRSGIEVVSLDGRQRWHLDESVGLPPYEPLRYQSGGGRLRVPVLLHPIESGRCLAIGRYGKNSRLWFAILTLPEATSKSPASDLQQTVRPEVKVFHTATHLGGSNSKGLDDIHEIFRPSWVIELPNTSEKRTLLVNRGPRRPLLIDVESLSVSIMPQEMPGHALPAQRPQLAYGRLAFERNWKLLVFPLPDRNATAWEMIEFNDVPQMTGHIPVSIGSQMNYPLLRHGDNVFTVGKEWLQLDLRTHAVEALSRAPIPLRDRYEHYGQSSHYGMVAWNRGDRLHQVRVLPPDRPRGGQVNQQSDARSRFPFVPENARVRHAQAINALGQLGARTDSVWWRNGSTTELLLMMVRGRNGTDRRWATVVWLDEHWRGNDNGLQHLLDLSGPLVVYVMNAGITNEGMQLLGQLTGAPASSEKPPPNHPQFAGGRVAPLGDGLLALCLAGTEVNDAGLSSLQNLSHLRYLHLDSTDDATRLTDAGFAKLSSLSIERLTLRGAGFSDTSLQSMMEMQTLHFLRLNQTATTATGWQALKERRKWTQIEDN